MLTSYNIQTRRAGLALKSLLQQTETVRLLLYRAGRRARKLHVAKWILECPEGVKKKIRRRPRSVAFRSIPET